MQIRSTFSWRTGHVFEVRYFLVKNKKEKTQQCWALYIIRPLIFLNPQTFISIKILYPQLFVFQISKFPNLFFNRWVSHTVPGYQEAFNLQRWLVNQPPPGPRTPPSLIRV